MINSASHESSPRSHESNSGDRTATSGLRAGVGELLHDVVSLGELQAQLLAIDVRESLQKTRAPAVLLTIGASFGLAAATTLLFALAEGLVSLFQWERALAYLVSGLSGGILAGFLLWLAWRRAGLAAEVFLRSRAELTDNVRWVKAALARRQHTE